MLLCHSLLFLHKLHPIIFQIHHKLNYWLYYNLQKYIVHTHAKDGKQIFYKDPEIIYGMKQEVIVTEDSAIKSLDDLKGDGSMKFGVQQDTTGDIYATGDYGEDAITRYDNGAVAVQALLADKVDCVIIDNEPAKSYVAANEGLKVLDTEYTVEDYAICFAKENTELQEKVNGALEELIKDGSVKEVIEKYIPAE